MFSGGNAYSFVTNTLVSSFPPETRHQIVEVYTDALKVVWYVALAFAIFAFLLVFVEKEIEMRTTLETEFGLKDEQKKGEVVELEAAKGEVVEQVGAKD